MYFGGDQWRGGNAPKTEHRQSRMNAQDSQTLQLHETVVWTPDGMKGEVVVKDSTGIKVHWADDQFGYYQFTDLLSQIERCP
jgi:hypothetical protein